jgi:hypothetical protein
MVIKEYRDQHGNQPPAELFLHAKSSFTEEEWRGFKSGVPPETNIVGVQIADAKDNMKLFRPRNYPVLRGSALLLGDDQAFLWTAGYVPRLDTYLGPETPNPLLIRRRRCDRDFDTILRDVMGLTKINFNSCLHNDRLPVTIRFADAVGEIMLAAPQTGEPRLPFNSISEEHPTYSTSSGFLCHPRPSCPGQRPSAQVWRFVYCARRCVLFRHDNCTTHPSDK